jgi:hypothetical protein
MRAVRHLLRTLLVGVAVIVVAYVGWDRVEAYRLDRAIAEIRERGEPTDVPVTAQPLPTAEQEEAARLYVAAAERAREIAGRDFRMTRYDVDTVVGSVDVRELEEIYRPDAPALQLLDRASALPFAGFGDAFDGPEWMNTQGLQALSGLSALRADLLAYRGHGDEAAQALVAALRVQRTLPDLFQRYFAGIRQFASLRVLLRHAAPSAPALERLQHAFAALPDEDGLDRDLLLRRARLIEAQAAGPRPADISAPAAFVFHPFLARAARLQLEQFPEALAAARMPWPDKYAAMAGLSAGTVPRGRSPLRNLLTGQIVNLASLGGRAPMGGLNLAIRRVALATIAVERYRRAHAGQMPASLATLVPSLLPAVPIDPFSGEPIVYRALADGYVVYSLDINRIDNGGQFYGGGAMSNPPITARDFGIRVPLTPRPGRQ